MRGRLESRAPASDQRDRRAVAPELEGDRTADTAGGAGDDDDLAFGRCVGEVTGPRRRSRHLPGATPAARDQTPRPPPGPWRPPTLARGTLGMPKVTFHLQRSCRRATRDHRDPPSEHHPARSDRHGFWLVAGQRIGRPVQPEHRSPGRPRPRSAPADERAARPGQLRRCDSARFGGHHADRLEIELPDDLRGRLSEIHGDVGCDIESPDPPGAQRSLGGSEGSGRSRSSSARSARWPGRPHRGSTRRSRNDPAPTATAGNGR